MASPRNAEDPVAALPGRRRGLLRHLVPFLLTLLASACANLDVLTEGEIDRGPVGAPAHDSWAWMVNGYMPQTLGAQVGTALATQLMGREREMGTAFHRMVEQWMEGPPAWARSQLGAAGVSLPWGTDYSLVRGAGFCRAAWLATGGL